MKPFHALCISRVGTCLGTMAFAGALPVFSREWQLNATDAGSIQTVFSLTNAGALLVTSWLSDTHGARKIYLLFSWLGCIALLLFALFADSYASALLMMAFVGLTQGGAYTPAMLLAIKMNRAPKRGYALGMILAAGSLGYLLSVFLSGWSALRWGASAVFYLCAAGAFIGALSGTLALASFDARTPVFAPCYVPAKGYALKGGAFLLLVGYIAHCWELLGNWAWTPALLVQVLQPFSFSPLIAGFIVAVVVHLAGMFATLIVGTISDYFDRSIILIFIGGIGAVCSLLLGWSVSWGAGWTLWLAFIASFFILGDSGVLSAAIADNVPAPVLGRIMGLRSLLGFGIGSLAPLSFGMAMDASHRWDVAYSVLAAGGATAFISALLLHFYGRQRTAS
ncbi:MFS transporter [Kosakonia sp.]|uniref:MFS transporter n=1 Tax=Kosakonia sp. TaxID=1916651 RepID=UPI00289675B3|nr:MFS transporter [Kosakonia sp.]